VLEPDMTRGTCTFCGRDMTMDGMARHLAVCTSRKRAIERANAADGEEEVLYHLQIQDQQTGLYWLHLEMRGSATLEDLDDYLRAIWLECCGHLSRFSLGSWDKPEIPMRSRARDVLEPGLRLQHIYDFGESSWTAIDVLRTRTGKSLTGRPLMLMARNHQPLYPCVVCGEPAYWLCMECLIERGEWVTLCDRHAEEHSCRNYGEPRELLNSPRTGMCGYVGPDDPPYFP